MIHVLLFSTQPYISAHCKSNKRKTKFVCIITFNIHIINQNLCIIDYNIIDMKYWEFTITKQFNWKIVLQFYVTISTHFDDKICINSLSILYDIDKTNHVPFGSPGGLLSQKLYVDVPTGSRKSDYLNTNFLPNFPPISMPFLKEKHPILTKLGAFYNNLPKIHQIYVIWAASSLMKTPRSLYQILRKKRPKRQEHIHLPCHGENPPQLEARCL